MGDDKHKRPRTSRKETTATILDAAETVFAERGYSAVTVRDIAAAAGVSHALVHRYLGSKKAIYRATLRRRETAIRDAAPEDEGLLESTSLMLREAWLGQARHLRLIVQSALQGLPYSRTSGRFVATERLIELAEQAASAEGEARDPDAPDPRFIIASIVAMLLGWVATKDWVLPATGIQEMSDEEFLDAFERVLLDVERLYFPATGEAPRG